MAIDNVKVTGVGTTELDQLQKFTAVGTPLLSEGRTNALLAKATHLWSHINVYGDNVGERELHVHPTEDHIFFVLSGSATFHNSANETIEIGMYEGVMIPKGVAYGFESNPGDALVLLRMGAGELQKAKPVDRAPAAKPGPRVGVPMPGRFLQAPAFR